MIDLRCGVLTQARPPMVRLDGYSVALPIDNWLADITSLVGQRVTVLVREVPGTKASELVLLGGEQSGGVGPGFFADYAGGVVPAGWLKAEGQLLKRADYPGLFAAIGTIHGAGDGATTFQLPDTRKRVLVGQDVSEPSFATLGQVGGEISHVLTVSEMPTHSHGVIGGWGAGPGNAGAWRTDGNSPGTFWGPTAESGGGQPHNNLPPFIVSMRLIKT